MKYNNSNNNTGIAAVILSAGYSSRMKRFKPLLHVGETTAVQKLVRSVKDAGIGRIVTVTGCSRELLQPVLDSEGSVIKWNKRGMYFFVQNKELREKEPEILKKGLQKDLVAENTVMPDEFEKMIKEHKETKEKRHKLI